MYDQHEDERGYLVYVNRYNGTSQPDNPNLTYVVNKINEKFCASKYSTYRCACKLFALQKALHTNCIPFQTVCTILDRHCLNQIDSAPSVKPTQLTAVLHDVYFAAEQLGYFSELSSPTDRETLIATLAGLFWAVYDPKRCSPISVLELKQTFLLLCDTQNFEQVVWEHFQLTSDHNLCVSRHRFEAMLMNLTKLLTFLGEPDHLKTSLVQEIVGECFAHYPGLVGLTEYQFTCLWKLSSKFSYYSNVLALSKRLRDSEFVVHSVQCFACRATIQGLRFKCQRCRNLSLCIDCFSHGFATKNHNVGHKMYEISTNGITSNKISTLLLKICNLFNQCPSSDGQTHSQKPSTFDNMEAKLIDTNAVELQDIEPTIPAASSTLRGTLSRTLNSTSSAPLRKVGNKNASIFSNIDCQLFLTTSTQSNGLAGKIYTIVEILEDDSEKYRLKLANLKANNTDSKELLEYFDCHGKLIADQLKSLKEVCTKISRGFPQSCSTPYRSTSHGSNNRTPTSIRESLQKSIHGAELNKSYVNENLQEDLSVRDVSSWFHLNRPSDTILEQMADSRRVTGSGNSPADELTRCIDNLRIDTQMANFKDLLLKVREIVDDSYSDNTELARTTQQLEKALDRIIEEEERKRFESI